MDSVLERLQNDVHDLLRDSNLLAGVEILIYESSDLGSALRIYAREPLGICAVVMPPLPLSFRNGAAHHGIASVELQIRVVEDIGANRGPRRALETAEIIHRLLTGMAFGGGNYCQSLLPASNKPWTISENFPESTRLEIELCFWAQLFLKPAKILWRQQ
ncbi:MAG: hypothetical protein LBB38_01045 [Puniceicoccales bacterium]|jgi:hypothetical protein|nr:hypothetical protein [Puniceicoccales bacterium]